MINPIILAAYSFSRNDMQTNAIDACTDVAQFYGVQVSTLAKFIASVGIDSARLSLIA